jgi:hypothetical protein
VGHPRRTRCSQECRKATWLKFTGLSGGAPDCPVTNGRQRQRSAAKSAGDAWQLQRSGGTGLSGMHRTVSGAPTGPELQRSYVPDLEGNQAPNRLQ